MHPCKSTLLSPNNSEIHETNAEVTVCLLVSAMLQGSPQLQRSSAEFLCKLQLCFLSHHCSNYATRRPSSVLTYQDLLTPISSVTIALRSSLSPRFCQAAGEVWHLSICIQTKAAFCLRLAAYLHSSGRTPPPLTLKLSSPTELDKDTYTHTK